MSKNWFDSYKRELYPYGLRVYNLEEFLSEYCKNESSDLYLQYHPYNGENHNKGFGYCTIEYLNRTGSSIESFTGMYLAIKDPERDKMWGSGHAAYHEEVVQIFKDLRQGRPDLEEQYNVEIKIGPSPEWHLSLKFCKEEIV